MANLLLIEDNNDIHEILKISLRRNTSCFSLFWDRGTADFCGRDSSSPAGYYAARKNGDGAEEIQGGIAGSHADRPG